MKSVARFGILLGLVSCLIVLLAGPAYRLGLLGLELALLTGFRLAVYAGLGAAVLGLAALLSGVIRRPAPLGAGLLAILLGLAGAAVPILMRLEAERVPRIHDITTDVHDPPAFEALLARRADAPNPSGYDPAVAPLQQDAYPDLQPIRLREPEARVLAAAREAALALGWEIVAVDAAAGRLEATATTPWFGFVDDIVIRIRALGAATVVDARSKSRVGRSDLGKNAERLRAFRHELLARTTGPG